MFKQILFLVFFTFSTLSSSAFAREKIENYHDKLFDNVEFTQYSYGDIKIYAESPQKAEIVIGILPAVLESINFHNMKPCKDLKVELYLLDDKVLLDRDVMHFLDWQRWNDKDIWGSYDSFHSGDTAELYIGIDQPSEGIYETVAHEFYHYKQDAMCLYKSESPAHTFGKRFVSSL